MLALDLDGTLLDRQSRLLDETRQAVLDAIAAGLQVVLVTGRSWRSTRPIYDQLGLTGPAICYLGALVVADGTGRILRHRPLAEAAWCALRDLSLEEGLPVTACVGADQAVLDGTLPEQPLVAADTAFATRVAPDFAGWAEWNPYTEFSPDLGPCQRPPTMLAVYGEQAVSRILAAFPSGLPESQFDLSDRVAGETVLHIWHAEADKGRALARFCQERAISPEAVAAFGDALMDSSMLRYAGLSVVMPDGDERLKAAANWVATPAEAIRRILYERGR